MSTENEHKGQPISVNISYFCLRDPPSIAFLIISLSPLILNYLKTIFWKSPGRLIFSHRIHFHHICRILSCYLTNAMKMISFVSIATCFRCFRLLKTRDFLPFHALLPLYIFFHLFYFGKKNKNFFFCAYFFFRNLIIQSQLFII